MRSFLIAGAVAVASASQLAIAGYDPGSKVTDHNAIDLDQKALETAIAGATPDYALGWAIYTDGGYSKSQATITVAGITTQIDKSTVVTGVTASGAAISAKVSSDVKVVTPTPATTDIAIAYPTGEDQATYQRCIVGALPAADHVTTDCFDATANIIVGSTTYTPSDYTLVNTKAGRTLQGFSTGAKKKMQDCSVPAQAYQVGCPYKDFMMFFDFYGVADYADQWVTAAFGTSANSWASGPVAWTSHAVDFTDVTADPTARREFIKKGTAYMNVWMYVVREFEDAIDDCSNNCINCNDDPVHAWDEGVAFYTGSLEGTAGTADGKLVHQLADKRCANFMTCGQVQDAKTLTGTSQVNFKLQRDFALGKHELRMGNCAAVRPIIERVTAQMSIPLIQGTLKYAWSMGNEASPSAKAKAEAATFAAAIVPRVAFCSQTDADLIWANVKHGAATTDFAAVKTAFENNYACLNITCAEVGGFYLTADSRYYEGADPCTDPTASSGLNSGTIAAIAVGAAVAALLLLCVCCMAYKEKKGRPIFYDLEGNKPKGGAKA